MNSMLAAIYLNDWIPSCKVEASGSSVKVWRNGILIDEFNPRWLSEDELRSYAFKIENGD